MNKTKIKNFSIWARRHLIEVVANRMRFLGIDDSGIKSEMDGSTDKLKLYDMGTAKPAEVSGKDIPKRDRLVNAIREHEKTSDYKTAYETAVEEVAYTWFNRLIAIRFMEVNDYLPTGVRVLSSESGKREPDIVTQAADVAPELGLSADEVWSYKDENKLDELFRILFLRQCKKLHDILPELFDSSQDDYTEMLLPISFIDDDGFIRHLVTDIDEADFNVSEQGQVEIIGWLYQYYNSEKKDAVFAAMSNKVKVSKENIAAATQLFTPDWIVRYMVENSLGRLWYDGHPDTSARAEWKYYLDEAEQTAEVQAQLDEIRAGRKDLTPEQITFIDPCMGSGHILVYAFDVLMQIYLSAGYTERDAAQSIVRKNLWGLDLDKRAYQLAYFAVMMKARQYDRRFLTRGIKPNLSHFQDIPDVDVSSLSPVMRDFVLQFKNADTYGSLITVTADDRIDEEIDKFSPVWGFNGEHLEHLMQLYKILSQRY
ncbi:MAG: BREX-1 system adenine-specific DNA-methyltransferase PglX, partial [Oscillospiraceae bacterium]|nr:BREX-1 system adenine-specific DNA-methyltransferase PglX [Oscillospiraceae bacterium]